MIITELARRRRAERILVLTKKSMLTQFQAELWNRFNIPLVRLDSAGIAKLRLRIPANRNPFEVYHSIIISIDTPGGAQRPHRHQGLRRRGEGLRRARPAAQGHQEEETKEIRRHPPGVRALQSVLSSPEACGQTVERRLQRIGDEKTPERDSIEAVGEALGGLTLERTSRFQLFLQQLQDIGWNGKAKSPRVLVFTESRPTQDALAAAVARHFGIDYSDRFEDQARQPLATIHGSHPDIHLMKTVESFGIGSSPMRMLIATDVASEGINLHHECHHVIHYDLPWSIITLIQRNGRVDRLGQTESPELRYFLVDTQQGLLDGDREIFERLIAKVEEINQSRRQGESVLKLYDPEAEERWIAEHGVIPGKRRRARYARR